MQHGLLGNNVVTQVGIVVADIEKSAREFASVFGIDVPEAIETDALDKARTQFKGNDTAARARLAFMDFGSLQIELIEPDEHPSTWREFLETRGEGIHHLAFVIDGMQETIDVLAARGCVLEQKGEYTGGRYAYVNATDSLKMIIELLEND